MSKIKYCEVIDVKIEKFLNALRYGEEEWEKKLEELAPFREVAANVKDITWSLETGVLEAVDFNGRSFKVRDVERLIVESNVPQYYTNVSLYSVFIRFTRPGAELCMVKEKPIAIVSKYLPTK